jgi:PHD/YefM family antitoxin component YafN of YafNO toxin-antitoxin module
MSLRDSVTTRDASTARVPTPAAGEAILFVRYQSEAAVVVNPEDFHRLADLDAAISELAGPEADDLAVRAHQQEALPGTPIEDPHQLDALLQRRN